MLLVSACSRKHPLPDKNTHAKEQQNTAGKLPSNKHAFLATSDVRRLIQSLQNPSVLSAAYAPTDSASFVNNNLSHQNPTVSPSPFSTGSSGDYSE